MLLKEIEAKNLLASAGIAVPRGVVVSSPAEKNSIDTAFPGVSVVYKAQVLHGNRALSGLIAVAHTTSERDEKLASLFASKDAYGEKISEVLVEELITHTAEYYLSFQYDTRTRSLVCHYSQAGGVGMDVRGSTVRTVQLSVESQPKQFEPNPQLLSFVQKLWKLFLHHDAVLIEINPLVFASETEDIICLDAKIELEDAARFRHPEWSQKELRSAGEKQRTALEKAAIQISRQDHRGVAGESFFEFPGGTVGVLASGGGASALAMDGLVLHGLQPANYTEYSGNPRREKVAELTKLVASIPTLEAIFVVGSNANFTDIFETLSGVVDGLLGSTLGNHFPVVIRRGGPRWEEAFAMVRERLAGTRFTVTLLGPEVPILDSVPALLSTIAQSRELRRQSPKKE